MEKYLSPLLEDLSAWRKHEASEAGAYNRDISNNRSFLKNRLKQYRKIYRTHSRDKSAKGDLKVLAAEIRDLEKGLYTGWQRRARAAGRILAAVLSLAAKPAGRLARAATRKLKPALEDLLSSISKKNTAAPISDQELAAQVQGKKPEKNKGPAQIQTKLELLRPAPRKRLLTINTKGRGQRQR